MLVFKINYECKLSKELFINLRGGLGNQLFCYFAGQYFSEVTKFPIKLFYYSESNPHDKENSNIASFELSNNLLNAKKWKFRYVVIKLIFSKLFRGGVGTIKFRRNKIDMSNLIFSEIYTEQGLGFNEEIQKFNQWAKRTRTKKLYLRGNFQNFNYYDNCYNKQLKLKDPSSWYHRNVYDIEAKKPIIMHIRLGNYLDLGNTLGILSDIYYRNALNEARRQFPYSPVWVFSNDVTQAVRLLGASSKTEFRFIEDSTSHDPAESLLLMGMGVAFIASNSTFSLWAAKLAVKLDHTFVPDPFYKLHPFNDGILIKPWQRITANWLSDDKVFELRNLH